MQRSTGHENEGNIRWIENYLTERCQTCGPKNFSNLIYALAQNQYYVKPT